MLVVLTLMFSAFNLELLSLLSFKSNSVYLLKPCKPIALKITSKLYSNNLRPI